MNKEQFLKESEKIKMSRTSSINQDLSDEGVMSFRDLDRFGRAIFESEKGNSFAFSAGQYAGIKGAEKLDDMKVSSDKVKNQYTMDSYVGYDTFLDELETLKGEHKEGTKEFTEGLTKIVRACKDTELKSSSKRTNLWAHKVV